MPVNEIRKKITLLANTQETNNQSIFFVENIF
jgi:hypothetical protein